MWRAVTSTILIAGQLALLGASSVYICTSADGTQRVEWGECDCADLEHGHDVAHTGRLEAGVGNHHDEVQLAQPPCQCQHRPLSEGTQAVSRCEHETRGNLLVLFADDEAGTLKPAPNALSTSRLTSPRGHTPLFDRLSVCLRC